MDYNTGRHFEWWKRLTRMTAAMLALLFSAVLGQAQGTLAPLFLFTQGAGSIIPYPSGQMLTVGQSYELTAVPEAGFVFSSWQPVNIFEFTTYLVDSGGVTVPVTSLNVSLVPTYFGQPIFGIIMQSVRVIENIPGVSLMTQSSGWQANFVPVPEPSGLAVLGSGLAAYSDADRTPVTIQSGQALRLIPDTCYD